jgi:hypothetical protein
MTIVDAIIISGCLMFVLGFELGARWRERHPL